LGRARQANSTDEAEERLEVIEIYLGDENENANGSERQGWKVMEFGLAWFWLLTSGT
jgi:hypothetical protein